MSTATARAAAPLQPSSFLPHPFRPLPSPASSPTWSPSHRDCQVFQWVKFDGHTQAWVAQLLEIDQSTVSRIIQRYERWIASGGPSECGHWPHEEQVSYQRWLTYERNERLLASAIRLAAELEQGGDVAESTITHHASDPNREIEVKTHHSNLDRAAAARFLRLAHRINMDQLKLVTQSPLPTPSPHAFAADDQADLPESDFAPASHPDIGTFPDQRTSASSLAPEASPASSSAATASPQPNSAPSVHNRSTSQPNTSIASPSRGTTYSAAVSPQEFSAPAYHECLSPPTLAMPRSPSPG